MASVAGYFDSLHSRDMQDYRLILKDEFRKKVQRNKRFTLRAFAQLLELNSGSMSAILNGQRQLPRTHWDLCSSKLNLTQSRKEKFLKSLGHEFKLKNFDFADASEKPNLTLVADSKLAILSEWEYAAVLCLMDLSQFDFTIDEIARHLGLSRARAELIFNHLLTSQLVQYKTMSAAGVTNGKWVKRFDNFNTTEDIQSKALMLSHKNEMDLAQKAIEKIPVHEREFSSVTFAGSSKDLRKMKIWLRQMKADFDKKFEKKNGDQVFLFSMQMFPLSQKVKKPSKQKVKNEP